MLHPFLPAIMAALVAAALRLAARWRPAAGVLALPVGLLAGAVVLCLPFNLRAVGSPRIMPDVLLGVALVGVGGAVAAGRVRRRWLVGGAVCFLSAWWVAHAPPAAPEFWRVGLAVTLAALVLCRAGLPALACAGVAGAVACGAAGAAPVWASAFLLPAAGCAVMVRSGAASLPGATSLASVCALVVLAGGRAMAGHPSPVDMAAMLPIPVALLAGPVLCRLPRVVAAGRARLFAPLRSRTGVAVRRRRA